MQAVECTSTSCVITEASFDGETGQTWLSHLQHFRCSLILGTLHPVAVVPSLMLTGAISNLRR